MGLCQVKVELTSNQDDVTRTLTTQKGRKSLLMHDFDVDRTGNGAWSDGENLNTVGDSEIVLTTSKSNVCSSEHVQWQVKSLGY